MDFWSIFHLQHWYLARIWSKTAAVSNLEYLDVGKQRQIRKKPIRKAEGGTKQVAQCGKSYLCWQFQFSRQFQTIQYVGKFKFPANFKRCEI